MQPQEYISLYELEDDFWWFVGMREISAALLDPILANGSKERRVLDVGCGTGANLGWLSRYASNEGITGLDLVPEALDFCRRRGRDNLIRGSATHLPLADATIDLLTSFDVLVCPPEANADEIAIDEMYRVLRPGGIAFVRAAAYSWMRGDHDRAVNSVRRFTLKDLQKKMVRSGFEIRRATYANMALLPIAAMRRLVLERIGFTRGSDVKPVRAQWLNSTLKTVLSGEAYLLKNSSSKLPAGLSAICIARKPDLKPA
jgi:SAM-dependent methyltransferase